VFEHGLAVQIFNQYRERERVGVPLGCVGGCQETFNVVGPSVVIAGRA